MSDDISIMQESRSIPGGRGGSITPITTTERARELARARWEAKAKAIRAGVGDAAPQLPDVKGRGAYTVLRAVSEAHAMHAYAAGETGAAASFKLLLEHGWPKPDKPDATSTEVPPNDDMAQLVALWRQAKADNPDLARRAEEALHGNR